MRRRRSWAHLVLAFLLAVIAGWSTAAAASAGRVGDARVYAYDNPVQLSLALAPGTRPATPITAPTNVTSSERSAAPAPVPTRPIAAVVVLTESTREGFWRAEGAFDRSRGFGLAADAAETADASVATVGRDAAESCLNSFTADTPVTMADGSEEPISQVKVGDKVLATDPETGHTEARPVAALIRHSGKHAMLDLTLSDGSKITTTDHHPFWDATTGTFTDAINLRVGDQVLSDHGWNLTLSAEYVYDRDLTAYNLQIDGIHTYYVGTTPVLVHNSCRISNPSSFEGATRSQAEQELAANGWQEAGATARSGGVRWRQPGNISNQVRIMPGNPEDLNLIKQGPYIRFSISGTKYGPFSLLDF